MLRYLALLALCALPAWAHPTISGTLESMEPGRWTLDQGRTVTLTSATRFEISGRAVTAAAFHPGMRVVVQVRGSLQSPVLANLVVDYASAAGLVQHTASAPGYTPVGDFPSTGGVATAPAVRPGSCTCRPGPRRLRGLR